jgi:cytochrome P450
MAEQFPSNPIEAVTHPDPYPYYADLAARAPLAWDGTLGLWVAASAEAVTAVLTSEICRVRPPAEPVPRAFLGSPAADIFRHLVRMNDGPRHQALKPTVTATLASLDAREEARRIAAELDPRQVNDFAFRLPVYTVATLLGVPPDALPQLSRWMADFAPALAPGSTPDQVERGKEAAGHLLSLFRSFLDADDAVLANHIGFLFQAHDATAGLIGNALLALARRPETRELSQVIRDVLRDDPPIQNTRRFVVQDGLVAGQPMKEGDAVLVLLAAANRAFGTGPHACPGETLAVTIAQAGVEALLQAGLDLERLAASVTYRPSANARIPLFGKKTGNSQ